jgi:leucyl/phenylalanyl-tRNA--protein transferase
MAVYLLSSQLYFPPPEEATEEGIVAVGGDFAPERLLLAYRQGIFPWPVENLPLLWFSPDPRCVLVPERAHFSRSLRRRLRRGAYEVTADTAFSEVIRACAAVPRRGQRGTWITPDLCRGYEELHRSGYAHSIEVRHGGRLVGGMYGISLGRAFVGESMFTCMPDASKVALATLLGNLVHWGFSLLDCQVRSDHVIRFGAVEWPRQRYLAALRAALEAPTRLGPWTLDLGPREAEARIPG